LLPIRPRSMLTMEEVGMAEMTSTSSHAHYSVAIFWRYLSAWQSPP
jgi:hypothetical protein